MDAGARRDRIEVKLLGRAGRVDRVDDPDGDRVSDWDLLREGRAVAVCQDGRDARSHGHRSDDERQEQGPESRGKVGTHG